MWSSISSAYSISRTLCTLTWIRAHVPCFSFTSHYLLWYSKRYVLMDLTFNFGIFQSVSIVLFSLTSIRKLNSNFFKPWKACASSCKLKSLEVGALQELYSQSSNSISQWIFHLCIPVSLLVIGYFPSQSRYHPFYTVQEKRQKTCFPYPREGWLYVSQ